MGDECLSISDPACFAWWGHDRSKLGDIVFFFFQDMIEVLGLMVVVTMVSLCGLRISSFLVMMIFQRGREDEEKGVEATTHKRVLYSPEERRGKKSHVPPSPFNFVF